jgi:glycosyltransferase involved in cell wall biosynthesis
LTVNAHTSGGFPIGGVVPVAVADEVRASIQQLYGYPDPRLIPNGIPTDEYAPDPHTRAQWRQAHGIEPHATVLTHVGRFAPPKNHALLIEAFAQVRSDAPLNLLLVGGGELENAVREQVAALGLHALFAPLIGYWLYLVAIGLLLHPRSLRELGEIARTLKRHSRMENG